MSPRHCPVLPLLSQQMSRGPAKNPCSLKGEGSQKPARAPAVSVLPLEETLRTRAQGRCQWQGQRGGRREKSSVGGGRQRLKAAPRASPQQAPVLEPPTWRPQEKRGAEDKKGVSTLGPLTRSPGLGTSESQARKRGED